MLQQFTIFHANRETTLPIEVENDHLFISHEQLQSSFGWELKPEGLCQDDICLLVPPEHDLRSERGLDLQILARLWNRPLATNFEYGIAYLGDSITVRQDSLRKGIAPEFTLPDLNGKLHSLSDYHGHKIFLIAYASW